MIFVSWNVENIRSWLDDPQKRALRQVVEGIGVPDVLMLQEVKVRPQDVSVVEQLTTLLPGYTCHVSLCSDAKNVTFRGGRAYGVATYVRNEHAIERAWSPEWDREGRILIVEIGDLAILNLYAVNGTNKRYWDHELGRYEGDRHQFKRRVQARLIELGKALKKRKKELVFAGDFNVTRTRFDTHPRLRTEEPHALARAHLNDVLIPELDVVDVWRELYPDDAKYSWFADTPTLDASRVDYFLVSRTLLPRVDDAGIEEEHANRFGTDHAPLWLRLKR